MRLFCFTSTLFCLPAAALFVAAVHAAPQADGVLAELRGERTMLVATRLRPGPAPDRVVLVGATRLRGADRDIAADLGLDPRQVRAVDPSRDYLVVYTTWRRVYGPVKYAADPTGGKVINVPGLDPAIVPDTPHWRRVLAGKLRGWPDHPARFGRTVRDMTAGGDAALTDLLAHELLTNPRLFPRLDAATIDWLAALAARRDSPAELRAQMLDSAAVRGEFDRPTLAAVAAGILACAALPLDWQSPAPRLVLSALHYLEQRSKVAGRSAGRDLDNDLYRLIRDAEHPAVLEQAARLLATSDPKRVRAALTAAREKALLAPEVRRKLDEIAGHKNQSP